MKMLIRVSEIAEVRHFQKGWTDYLKIKFVDGRINEFSVYHYEDSMRQRNRCKQLKKSYNAIIGACVNKAEFVDIEIDD